VARAEGAVIGPAAGRADRLRQWSTVLLALAQPLAGALAPVFGIGRPIAAVAAESQTPAVPAGYAFLIWTPIFALAIAYAVWQALPARREDPLLRRLGWWIAAAFAGNVLWMLAAQLTGRNGWHLFALILLVLASALVAFLRERRRRAPAEPTGPWRRWLLQPLLGLQAGWVTAAAFANLSGALRVAGVAWPGLGETVAAALLVLVAGLVAAAILWLSRGSPWYAGAAAWAFAAILLANMGEREWNLLVAAAAAAVLVLLGVVLRAAWRREDRQGDAALAPAG
jgi:MFS family permease